MKPPIKKVLGVKCVWNPPHKPRGHFVYTLECGHTLSAPISRGRALKKHCLECALKVLEGNQQLLLTPAGYTGPQ